MRQGVRALIPALAPLDRAAREAALRVLPQAAAEAFRALPRADQSHALRVHDALVAAGETSDDLRAAALLHDIGKHPGVGVTQRTARVLMAHWPAALHSLAGEAWGGARWRTGLARLLYHATLGAERAARWGCTPATVAIIRASHDADAPEDVRRLQAADDLL